MPLRFIKVYFPIQVFSPITILMVIGFFSAMPLTTTAQDAVWVGGSGNWSDPTKWSPNTVPVLADFVGIDGDQTTTASVVTLDIDTQFNLFGIDAGDTLQGSGQLSIGLDGDIVNLGTINANQPNPLIIRPAVLSSNSVFVTNNGTMRASNGATLQIDGRTFPGGVAVFNNNVIEAQDGSIVEFRDNVGLFDGTLSSSGNGRFVIDTRSRSTQNDIAVGLIDVTIDPGTTVEFSGFGGGSGNQQHRAEIFSSLTNNGTIRLESFSDPQHTLAFRGTEVLLTGTGTIILDGVAPLPSGPSFQPQFSMIEAEGDIINDTDHTIRGGGRLFNNNGVTNVSGSVINHGSIIADDPRLPLIIAPVFDQSLAFLNLGTLQASNGGTLSIANGYFDNTDNTIAALDGSKVLFQDRQHAFPGVITIEGGTLSTVGTGAIVFGGDGSGNVTLKDVTIPTGTNLVSDNSNPIASIHRVSIEGTLTNHATWDLTAGGRSTDLIARSRIAGTGTIVLGDELNNTIFTSDLTVHEAGHTIRGEGKIESQPFGHHLNNHGSIIADVNGKELFVDGVRNLGTMKATNGGILAVRNGINDNHTITAEDGSTVSVQGTIEGGTFASIGSGQIELGGGLTNVTVDHNSHAVVFSTTARDTLTNHGEIRVGSVPFTARLRLFPIVPIQEFGTLAGTGSIILDNGIFWGTFVQEAGHTIRGSGRLTGDGTFERLVMINQGSIIADQDDPLRINIDTQAGSTGVTNEGMMKAEGAGGLEIAFGAFSNASGGQLIADSSVAVLENATLTNEFGGTISGSGVLEIIDGSFTNHGTIAPGNSPGILTVQGDYTQGSTGELEIELAQSGAAGTDYDQLAVTGNVALDGTLELQALDGFIPSYGDTFDVLTYGSRSGVFGQVTGAILSPELALGQFYDDTNSVLQLLATAPGDANGDLIVNIADFGLLAGNFNQPGIWGQGDFDGNGVTNINDFGLLAANFNGDFDELSAAAAEIGITFVPEPGTAAILLLTLAAVVRHRPRPSTTTRATASLS